MKLFLLFIFLMSGDVLARRFSPEELARELYRHGFPLNELNDWVCLVMGESSGDTSAMNHHNTDGSVDWGLFQINDRYWCGSGHNMCGVSCEELAKDDISRAARCAKMIKNNQGFKAWVAWNNNCAGRSLQDYTYLVCGSGRSW